MKSLIFISILISNFCFANSGVFLIDSESHIDILKLAEEGELSYSIDRNSVFCYTGNVDEAALLMNELHESEEFYSGGGGGHVLEELKITYKGIVGPKINLILRSEVTGEVEDPIFVLACKL